jgi:hypothetical protein
MKWQAALAGAIASVMVTTVALVTTVTLASVALTGAALADVRVTNDPGGEIASYVRKFEAMKASGERLVIDGPCLSACTLFTAFLPRDQVCVTKRAILGFHAASYYDDASRALVPTRSGTRLVMRLYPQPIRNWIERHGGLTPRIIGMRGHDLTSLYATCQVGI